MRYVPNRKAELKYVGQDYQILHPAAQSPSFEWDRKSYY
jgi:hypothetical protein